VDRVKAPVARIPIKDYPAHLPVDQSIFPPMVIGSGIRYMVGFGSLDILLHPEAVAITRIRDFPVISQNQIKGFPDHSLAPTTLYRGHNLGPTIHFPKPHNRKHPRT